MATVKALVVAGGGSGGNVSATGNSYSGGGGGAGGYIYEAAHALGAGSYPVVVGAGGTGSTTTRNNGANSSFDTLTAIGGGAGAEGSSGGFPNNPGNNGGSGGGASRAAAGGTATAGQGSNGGTGTAAFGSAASGGGSGAVGTHSGSTTGAAGGVGTANSISGASVTRAGGGGAGGYAAAGGAGGSGGGGAGGGDRLNGVNATANTGGGGGGAGSSAAGVATAPGAGGSGVVVIRYATADYGTVTGGTITTDGADTIHTFTSDGTLVIDFVAAWHEIGKGYIDTINVNDIGNPSISITGRGEEAVIIDCEILERLTYSTGSTDDMETVIQALLDDNMGFLAPTLYVPTPTSFIINEYIQDYGNLMMAIQAVASLAGYVVRYRYDTDGVNKLMLYRPNREAEEGEEDWEIGPTEYLALPLNKLDKLGIRNRIIVRYTDESNGLESTYYTPDPPTSDSISRYGQRDLPIELGEDSQLTNSAKVGEFALAIRSDLEFPALEEELESYGLWWVQLTDWVKVRPNEVTY